MHSTAREVVAAYQMEDTKLELSIVLPPNYPLGRVKVESGQQIDGMAKWKNCHMQLSKFLTHQVSFAIRLYILRNICVLIISFFVEWLCLGRSSNVEAQFG